MEVVAYGVVKATNATDKRVSPKNNAVLVKALAEEMLDGALDGALDGGMDGAMDGDEPTKGKPLCR